MKLKGTAVIGAGLGLLDITLGDAILESLATLDLGSNYWLGCSSLGEEPWLTVI